MSDSLAADICAINRIKGIYCDTIDRIVRDRQPEDEGILRSLFTEDAVIDFTRLEGPVLNGHAEILAHFQETLPSSTAWMWHAVGTEAIDVTGDTAIGRWTLLAMAQLIGGEDKPPFSVYGRYIDEFRKEGGVWRQCRLFFLNETKPAA